MLGDAEHLIDSLVKLDVIAECQEATDYCAGSNFIRKPQGRGVCLVVDLRALNSNSNCLGWPFRASAELQKNMLEDSRVYWTLDFLNRYFQVPIARESQNLTCFFTPFGKFKYLQLPQGYADSWDPFGLCTDPVVKNVSRVVNIVDDNLGQSYNPRSVRYTVRSAH